MPKPKIPPVRRRLPLSKAQKAHAQNIGQIVIRWNELHQAFLNIFIHMLQNLYSARKMWEEMPSDKSQRGLLKSYLEGLKEDHVITELIWIINKTDQLSPYRNSYVHVNVLRHTNEQKVSPDPLAKQKNADRLKDAQTKKLFYPLKGDITALQQYTMRIWWAIAHPNEPALQVLPKRPVLQVFPDTKRR